MSGVLEAICEDAEHFKDAICEQIEGDFFSHLYFLPGYALKTIEKPHLFGDERILPFTYVVMSSLNQTALVIC